MRTQITCLLVSAISIVAVTLPFGVASRPDLEILHDPHASQESRDAARERITRQLRHLAGRRIYAGQSLEEVDRVLASSKIKRTHVNRSGGRSTFMCQTGSLHDPILFVSLRYEIFPSPVSYVTDWEVEP